MLEWRRFLTRQLLEGYYSNQAFFRLHQQLGLLDNPDQARRLLCPGGPKLLACSLVLHEHVSVCALASGTSAQRVCDDVPAFTEGSVTLSIGAVRKLMNLVAFSGARWS